MRFFNYPKDEELQAQKNKWAQTESRPFSHVFLDNFLKSNLAGDCAGEITRLPLDSFVRYSEADFEYEKYALNRVEMFPPTVTQVFQQLHSPEFVHFLESLTGFSSLKVDEGRWGAGIHRTLPGGYLAVHKDFSVLPATFKDQIQRRRVLNIIGYLTKEWKASDGGALELWSNDNPQKIEEIFPHFNRWVVFDTRQSFHGHPYPYMGEEPRSSIATYYYVDEVVPEIEWRSTEYLKLPWKEDTPEYREKRLARADFRSRYKDFLP